MEYIDIHTHIYPAPIAKKAVKSICDFYGLDSDMDGTVEQLLSLDMECGISKSVILPVAVKAENVENINRFVAGEVKKNKEFIGFGTVHSESNIEKELGNIFNLGLKGIKLHPDIQGFNIDDKRLFPLYENIEGKIPVLFHCGDTRYDCSSPQRVKNIINNFKNLTVIAAHMGGYSVYDEAFELLKSENCFVDVSSSLMFLDSEKAIKLIRGYGIERVLFGSDYPLWNPVTEKERFERLNLKENEKEKIAYLNAVELLNI